MSTADAIGQEIKMAKSRTDKLKIWELRKSEIEHPHEYRNVINSFFKKTSGQTDFNLAVTIANEITDPGVYGFIVSVLNSMGPKAIEKLQVDVARFLKRECFVQNYDFNAMLVLASKVFSDSAFVSYLEILKDDNSGINEHTFSSSVIKVMDNKKDFDWRTIAQLISKFLSWYDINARLTLLVDHKNSPLLFGDVFVNILDNRSTVSPSIMWHEDLVALMDLYGNKIFDNSFPLSALFNTVLKINYTLLTIRFLSKCVTFEVPKAELTNMALKFYDQGHKSNEFKMLVYSITQHPEHLPDDAKEVFIF